MLRPYLLSLIVFSAGATSVGGGARQADVATWRWQVSAILDSQRTRVDPSPLASLGSGFNQRYQRYEGAGQPLPAAPTVGD
jgi:hypothetical protein